MNWLIKTPIAHRGLHDLVSPENSQSAIKKAIESGYNVEIDVHKTLDDIVVVHHDFTLQRSCNIDKKISDLTYKELQEYCLFNSSEKIPTLKNILKICAGKGVLIEIKNTGKVGKLEQLVLNQIKDFKGFVAIQSFNPFVINWFKKNSPTIQCGILSSYFKKEKLFFLKKILLKRLLLSNALKLDFVSYNTTDIPNKFIKKFKVKLAWVVSNLEEENRVRNYVDNIIFENYLPKK